MDKKANKLHFFPYYYPFGNKEPFFFEELEVYAKHFEKTVIYPWYRKENIEREFSSNINIGSNLIQEKSLFEYLKAFNVLFDYSVFKKNALNLKSVLSLAFSKKTVQAIHSQFNENETLFFPWAGRYALIGYFLKKEIPSLKLIIRVNGSDFRDISFMKINEMLFNAADTIIAISDESKVFLEKNYKFDYDKILVNKLGIRIPISLSPLPKSSTKTIVSCSNLLPIKQIDLIAETLSKLNDSVKWIHFGGPNSKALQLELDYKEMYPNLSVEMRGVISNPDILSFYEENEVDLFVNLSKSEGTPVSIMEAMSYGIPVLASNVGGISEMLDNNSHQLVEASPDQIVPIVNKIKYCIENYSRNQDFRHSMISNFKYSALKNYANLAEVLKK